MPVAIVIAVVVAVQSFAGMADVLPALAKILPVNVELPQWAQAVDATTISLGFVGLVAFAFVVMLVED